VRGAPRADHRDGRPAALGRSVLLAALAALLAPGVASAAIFIRLTETSVHRGGRLQLLGNAAAMPLYVLPVARAPSCMRHDTCASLMRRSSPPKPPFARIGRTPGTSPGFTSTHSFVVRLPQRISISRYKLFVWCAPCDGTLIPANSGLSSQTLRIRP